MTSEEQGLGYKWPRVSVGDKGPVAGQELSWTDPMTWNFSSLLPWPSEGPQSLQGGTQASRVV